MSFLAAPLRSLFSAHPSHSLLKSQVLVKKVLKLATANDARPFALPAMCHPCPAWNAMRLGRKCVVMLIHFRDKQLDNRKFGFSKHIAFVCETWDSKQRKRCFKQGKTHILAVFIAEVSRVEVLPLRGAWGPWG